LSLVGDEAQRSDGGQPCLQDSQGHPNCVEPGWREADVIEGKQHVPRLEDTIVRFEQVYRGCHGAPDWVHHGSRDDGGGYRMAT
jgi:hypothetical protein